MNCEEARELITALVDDELSYEERYAIEIHLGDCPRCMPIYGQELELKKVLRSAGASVKAPAQLRERILSGTRIFAKRGNFARWKGLLWPLKADLRLAFACAIVLFLLVPVLYVLWPTGKPVALAALETHESIVGGATSLRRLGSPREVKEFLFRSVGGTFAPMEYDFSVADLKAVGGLVRQVGGRNMLVTVYEGKGPPVSCYTFLGVEKDAPASARVVFDPEKEKNFYTFSQGRMNGVMRRVGERICILVSEMPLEELLALARGKATSSYGP
jgi:mycothiol system anti-sigma-R factor